MTQDTASYAAFHELVDLLRDTADSWLSADNEVETPRDFAEGIRNVLHLLSGGIDFYLEGDAERPEFVKIVSPIRRFMGDNPDAIYHFARIRDDRSYRIHGKRGDECYLSFTIHGRNENGALGATSEPVLTDINHRGFHFEADGSYEILLSPDKQPGNWIETPAGAASLIVRHYWEEEQGVPAADQRPLHLCIEPVTDPGPRPLLDDAQMAERLKDVTAFLHGGTTGGFVLPNPPPFISKIPNEIGTPMVFRQAETDAWGAVDIAYAMGPFQLAEGEALVIEGHYPECAFANLVLWNRYMQALEYRDRKISINRKQTVLEPDGSYRIVLAAVDPGVPNWLCTEGRPEGTMFWRFLLPEGAPEKPLCRVVLIKDLKVTAR